MRSERSGVSITFEEVLMDRVTNLPIDLDFLEIGKVELRGREEAVKIFAVHSKAKPSLA